MRPTSRAGSGSGCIRKTSPSSGANSRAFASSPSTPPGRLASPPMQVGRQRSQSGRVPPWWMALSEPVCTSGSKLSPPSRPIWPKPSWNGRRPGSSPQLSRIVPLSGLGCPRPSPSRPPWPRPASRYAGAVGFGIRRSSRTPLAGIFRSGIASGRRGEGGSHGFLFAE